MKRQIIILCLVSTFAFADNYPPNVPPNGVQYPLNWMQQQQQYGAQQQQTYQQQVIQQRDYIKHQQEEEKNRQRHEQIIKQKIIAAWSDWCSKNINSSEYGKVEYRSQCNTIQNAGVYGKLPPNATEKMPPGMAFPTDE
jgi:hypothetical protein